MRIHFLTLCFFGILFFAACGGEAPTDQPDGETSPADSLDLAGRSADTSASEQIPDCGISGEILDGNIIWMKESNLILAIVADSTTYDENLGASHRILEVYDSGSCRLVQREVLPVNESPDFPYYIARINYNNASELVGIRGASTIYIYDLAGKRLLPALKPQYQQQRPLQDAQSGHILRLEVWEDFLVGHAEDKGPFAFDLRDTDAPKAVMPFSEFETGEGTFHSLFLFPLETGGVQPAIPQFDSSKDDFSINPLFDEPQDLSTNIPKAAKNNRYLVLRKNNSQEAILIDMLNARLVDLPAEVATQKTQDILAWAKNNS